ncbi:MAG: dockerin type I repeat-containing protein, partial [Bacilli bacterium]
ENTKIELVVTAANNSTRKYIINVTKKKPTEPIEPEPTPDPEPEEKVLVKDVLDKASIKIKDNYIYGFEVGKNIEETINKFKNIGLEVTITSSKENGLIASGDKINIKTNSEEKELIVIIYGDVNGDGKISSADYINIKNHIMETKTLSDNEKIYADANKDGKISSADYIAIKNHIMEVSKISQ